MRSVSSKNITFFNNMKKQISDACEEATSRISVKHAIIAKLNWEGPKVESLKLRNLSESLRRLTELKERSYETEIFTYLLKKGSSAPKLVVSEFADTDGSQGRTGGQKGTKPNAPKSSSEKKITESLFDGEEEYNESKLKMSALH